ncbi:hypothetical protein QJQ45_028885, partial [Haematococcus lacustris]
DLTPCTYSARTCSPWAVFPLACEGGMGLVKRFVITKEPDLKRTVKKIVQFQPPCSAELAAMLDCFKRHMAGDADSACAQQRQALMQCTKSSKVPNVRSIKRNWYHHLDVSPVCPDACVDCPSCHAAATTPHCAALQVLGKTWKRYGF